MNRRRSLSRPSIRQQTAPSSTSVSPKQNKYRAKKVEIDGFKFDSKREGQRYQELKLLLRAGEIKDLQVHPRFALEVNGHKVCDYIADFAYFPVKGNGPHQRVVEDVKGVRSGSAWKIFRVKAKLFHALFGYEVTVV